ncbi:DNA polymerase III subunit epsilon [Aquirhabdus parva]|uniref:Ribonuclease H n=1 Tax=Aquirhabdus parva TaxID=2283318 RepID=A0A345P619_9GAMM|nr:DNA polymerase III subunit epsilon [Aquirhabdus parva]AXI02728.1 DNA polymerase III subunit epsilon [Aquirhabdus parva]
MSLLTTSSQMITLYVDGACRGNPGKGGWGVYVEYADGKKAEFCGGEPHTTNNRMELMAAIEGLARTDPTLAATVWTDSNYVQKGISEWIHNWKKKNWKKSDGGAVINADLWKILDKLSQNRKIDWRWIKGHAGHAGNEKADQLANQGLETQGPSIALANDKKQTLAAHMDSPEDKPLIIKAKNTESTSLMDLLLPPDEFDDYQEPNWLNEEDQDLSESYERFDEAEETLATQGSLTPTLPDDAYTEESQGIVRTHNTARLDAFTSSGKRQLILDTETTGFDPKTGDRIVEIGVIELINRKLTGNSLHVYLNPQRLVGESENIHGLSDAFLSDKPLFADIADELEAFLVGAEVIAHNASFDMRFLEAEMEMAGRRPLSEQITVTDTLAIAKRKHPGQKNSLDALAKRYEIKERDRTFHGALLDAEILADVYLLLTGGQVTLDMDTQEERSNQINESRPRIQRKLAVVKAHTDELNLHQAWIAEMDSGRDGAISIWHKWEQSQTS